MYYMLAYALGQDATSPNNEQKKIQKEGRKQRDHNNEEKQGRKSKQTNKQTNSTKKSKIRIEGGHAKVIEIIL